MSFSFSGIMAPVLTPFKDDFQVAENLFIEHCQWVLQSGCHFIAPFGTTSEALSLSLKERHGLLESLVLSGIDPQRIMPGTGMCSLGETVELTRHAVSLGCAAVMTLPPFFYKNPSEEGLFNYFSNLIKQVNSPDLRLCLYHIPPMATVGFSGDLVARLHAAFPETVVALKDSSGDWENTLNLINKVPGMAIFPGSETFLSKGMASGGAGCISATCNINPTGIRAVFDSAGTEDEVSMEPEMLAIRDAVQKAGLIPAMKGILAQVSGDLRWRNVRPPLMPSSPEQAGELIKILPSGLDPLASYPRR
ncbi:MAG: dihydrodipicolinate synthase family protein [Chloroflexi bacterium]|jgi:4-hydroxy-tetrahydrodipicolinate synthase|nr:dihydrodipicolinate synthase family protein [Chloroflexota bacterium]|tara:strand:- start:763 stop:1680 length:918 start_codon:yes stop_codon:yes gene_type:complete